MIDLLGQCLNLIYGPPASGKTTMCLMKVSKSRKSLFIDTENSASLERLQQISPSFDAKNLSLIKVSSFDEQHRVVQMIEKVKLFDTVIIDSFNHYYRKEIHSGNIEKINPLLARQLSILAEISRRGVKVLLTAQIYNTINGGIMPVGGNMIKNWCPVIVRLDKEPVRKITLEKHPETRFSKTFEIKNEGIIIKQ